MCKEYYQKSHTRKFTFRLCDDSLDVRVRQEPNWKPAIYRREVTLTFTKENNTLKLYNSNTNSTFTIKQQEEGCCIVCGEKLEDTKDLWSCNGKYCVSDILRKTFMQTWEDEYEVKTFREAIFAYYEHLEADTKHIPKDSIADKKYREYNRYIEFQEELADSRYKNRVKFNENFRKKFGRDATHADYKYSDGCSDIDYIEACPMNSNIGGFWFEEG